MLLQAGLQPGAQQVAREAGHPSVVLGASLVLRGDGPGLGFLAQVLSLGCRRDNQQTTSPSFVIKRSKCCELTENTASVRRVMEVQGGAEEGGARGPGGDPAGPGDPEGHPAGPGGPGGDPAGPGSCSPTQPGLPWPPGAMVPWWPPTPPIGGWVVAAGFIVWGEGGDKPSVDPPILLAWDC